VLNSVLYSVVGVVVLLGGLVFFHELGHYLVAKFFGVKVEVFSLGFGKKLFRKKWGETEYCVSLFPLGGYVKLMGDDPYKSVPPEDAARAFSTQKLYKRFAIVAAGPMANLLLAYVLFVMVFFTGQPMAGTRIGTVQVNSPAWQAGIRPKDRVAAINGTAVQTWNDLEDDLKTKLNERVELTIERGNAELKVPYTVGKVRTKNVYGEDEEVGGIKGIQPAPLDPQVGISNPESPAYRAGLRSGDVITKVGSRDILVYNDINEALTSFWKEGEPLTFSVKRGNNEQSFSIPMPAQPAGDKYSPLGLAQVIGLFPSELFVRELSKDSPAQKGGLQAGDHIVTVGGMPIYNFESIVDQVQEQGPKGETVPFVIERAGKSLTLNLKPIQTEQEDPITFQKYKKFMVGFAPDAAYHEPEKVFVTIRNPIKLLVHAGQETALLTQRMFVSIVKLAAGKIPAKNLGGPVLIASVAGRSLDAGFVTFIQTMAAISINLFLLNLFPIPILDGGHLLFFAMEAVKGRPVSIRTMEIANQVGMVFILALVVLTLFNDISRFVH
jgi:regulator of sigma E protease